MRLAPPRPSTSQIPEAVTSPAHCDDPAAGTASHAGRDTGQATTEYALVMLAAALIALLVVAWATGGGGAGKIGQLFDSVLDSVIDRAG